MGSEPGGGITMRFAPPFTPGGCTEIAQPDTMSGRMDGNDAFTLTVTGRRR
jgi:hypothetical protein